MRAAVAGSNTPQAIASFGTLGPRFGHFRSGIDDDAAAGDAVGAGRLQHPHAQRASTRSSEFACCAGIRSLRLLPAGAHAGPAENPFGDEQLGFS